MLSRDTGAGDFAINGRAPQAELPGGHGRRQTCFYQLKPDLNSAEVQVLDKLWKSLFQSCL